ncbi:MAG TPA: GTPase HflX [Candidatus Brocadiia bacterium]|nr:GTPase HflX [Candidatus Brocadiia bacterium]
MDLKRNDLSVRAERAILVGITPPGEKRSPGEILEELSGLAHTAGAVVVEKVCQYNHLVDPAWYVGKGKAAQIAELCETFDADVVICDDDLAPRQVRNLEQTLKRKTIDRSELILDIFATRAETTQAQLQVELAQLEYAYPRLKAMWTHFSRIVGGGMAGGVGVRGPGEKQLEVDRRLVEKRIHELRSRLKTIEKRQEEAVSTRKKRFLTACLVGYTNAGKSSMMNALTDAGVLVADKLFATLESTTRKLELGRAREIMVSDTVGFIRKLPHHLVASFHATLEEARRADLLLHVADVASPNVMDEIESVETVLTELGCRDTPAILVLNKSDIMRDSAMLPLLRNRHKRVHLVSAETGDGLDGLRDALREFCDSFEAEVTLRMPIARGDLASAVRRAGKVLEQTCDGEDMIIRARIPTAYAESFEKAGARITREAAGEVNEAPSTGSSPMATAERTSEI